MTVSVKFKTKKQTNVCFFVLLYHPLIKIASNSYIFFGFSDARKTPSVQRVGKKIALKITKTHYFHALFSYPKENYAIIRKPYL